LEINSWFVNFLSFCARCDDECAIISTGSARRQFIELSWRHSGQPATVVATEHQVSSPLEAHLYAPSRTAGFVQKGQQVWINYAAYPYQKFGMQSGTITQVSDTPISPKDLPSGQQQALLNAARSNEPLYRITVKLRTQDIRVYGENRNLRAGMTLDADVIQERRTVWEWVLDPIIGVLGRQQL
jgi:multidrug efflux pump subunit AcrA (membrane-fusion protein)